MAIGTPWFPAVRVSGASVCAAGRGGGQKLSYVYYEDEPGWRSSAKMLTKDEARRIAADEGEKPREPTGASSDSQAVDRFTSELREPAQWR